MREKDGRLWRPSFFGMRPTGRRGASQAGHKQHPVLTIILSGAPISRTGCAAFVRPRSSRKAEAAAARQASAQNATATWKAPNSAAPLAEKTPPRSAVANRPPLRATALFSPDADPVWRASTEPRTAVVSGATAPAM